MVWCVHGSLWGQGVYYTGNVLKLILWQRAFNKFLTLHYGDFNLPSPLDSPLTSRNETTYCLIWGKKWNLENCSAKLKWT